MGLWWEHPNSIMCRVTTNKNFIGHVEWEGGDWWMGLKPDFHPTSELFMLQLAHPAVGQLVKSYTGVGP